MTASAGDRIILDFAALWEIAHRTATSWGLRSADADDIAQFTILELMTTADYPRYPARWVRVVAQRSSAKLCKRSRRLCSLGEDGMDLECGSASSSADLRIDLARAFRKLPGHLVNVWIARCVEQRSFDELCRKTGLSRSTLNRRIEKGRRALETQLVSRSAAMMVRQPTPECQEPPGAPS